MFAVGENGAGKTTLLKMVMEMEGHEPTKGTRTSHRNLKFGYFTQHFVDQLDMSICPVEIMQKEFPGFKVAHLSLGRRCISKYDWKKIENTSKCFRWKITEECSASLE